MTSAVSVVFLTVILLVTLATVTDAVADIDSTRRQTQTHYTYAPGKVYKLYTVFVGLHLAVYAV